VPASDSHAEQAQPTPSLITYLFADRVVAPKRRAFFPLPFPIGEGSTRVPGLTPRIPRLQLAERLSAIAFWSLREQGVVALAIVTPVGIRRRGPAATVERLRAPGGVGLEAWIVGRRSDPAPRRVAEVAPGWSVCFRACRREGAERGLLRRDGLRWEVADPERVAALKPRFADLIARWERFSSDEPELHDALLRGCRRALAPGG
jgi:hypothetical protein